VNEVAVSAGRLRGALEDARRGLIERDALVELIALAAVAGEHLLVIGPPGTAKSEAVRRVARGLEASYFEYLLGRFTEPSEIFGPVDLRKLREDESVTEARDFFGIQALRDVLVSLERAILEQRLHRRLLHQRMRTPLTGRSWSGPGAGCDGWVLPELVAHWPSLAHPQRSSSVAFRPAAPRPSCGGPRRGGGARRRW
jgi:hypothetical protein